MLGSRLSVRDVLGPGGFAERAIAEFSARQAQIEMAEAVLDRLLEGGTAVIEAPTGVGKTLAYLVPAILSGRKVIISTHTKTLQDQVIDKDLPRLARILELAGVSLLRATAEDPLDAPFAELDGWGRSEPPADSVRPPASAIRYALMKGRSNYLCLDRLDRRTRQESLDLGTPPTLIAQIGRWARQTAHGDRAELAEIPEGSPVWADLDARAEICTGSRCPRFGECFVLRMRRAAEGAQLIIVNHHLLLADIALRAEAALTRDGRAFGEIIPSAEALIVDEAHALEEIAAEYFGGRVGSRKLERLGRDVAAFVEGGALDGVRSGARLAIDLALAQAVVKTEAVFRALPAADGRRRLSREQKDDDLRAARGEMGAAGAALDELASILDLEAAAQPNAESLARRVRDLTAGLRFVLEASDPDYVYWTERSGAATSLAASPIDVSRLLAAHLFEPFGATVLTSATLATGSSGVRYFLETLGAPQDTHSLILGSPFDYASQAALYLPTDAPDPDAPDAAARLARIGRELIELVDGGALFLFTSYRMMRAVSAQLAITLRHPVFVQGDRPKRDLIRSFVARAPAVLFATSSFWEGVDVPGDPLRLVLIDRLPFGSPGDPLVAARAERLESRGENAFNRLHLPRAILRLKQGFGRLVRTQHDRGIVAILDRRVQTRGYGRQFLRALPEAARVSDLEVLRAWWRHEASVARDDVERVEEVEPRDDAVSETVSI